MQFTKANPPEKFRQYVASFSGCTGGNPDSPIWCCGLEHGGGWEGEPIPESYFVPKSLDDFDGEHFWDDFWYSSSPFCQAIPKILLILKYGYLLPYRWDAEWMREHHIAGRNGLAMVFNACPISFKDRSSAWWHFNNYQVIFNDGSITPFKNWTQLSSFWLYEQWSIEQRKLVFQKVRQEKAPKLIINFGVNNLNQFFTLWGATFDNCEIIKDPLIGDGKKCSDGYLSIVKNDGKNDTIVCVLQFPSHQSGFSTEAFKRYIPLIRQRCIDHFGEDWLAPVLLTKAV